VSCGASALPFRIHSLCVAAFCASRLVRHIDVLGVDLRHHQLTQLDELLELLAGHHVAKLESLHAALGTVAQALKHLNAGLERRRH
jgi:hypothetical protein